MGLKPYDKYVPVDLLWLDSIPSHWSLLKIKYTFKERIEKGYPEEGLLAATQNRGVIPKSMLKTKTVTATKDLHLLKLVNTGDFVISLRSFQGGIEYAYYRGIISPAYTVLKPLEGIDSGYFKHFAKSRPFLELLKMSVTGIREGQNINYEELKNSSIPIPSSEEQIKIARYLDSQIHKINKYIKAKKKQIIFLKERKQAIINQAVTKGLNTDVKMKPSGIEWLGDIPDHWQVIMNKRLFKENIRPYRGGYEIQLSLSQRDGLIPFSEMKERSLQTSTYDNWKIVHKNDLVLNRFKAHLGVFFCSTLKGIVTFHYGVFEPKIELNSLYYEHLYHTNVYRTIYAGRSNGMTIGLQNLSNKNFYNVYTLLPPLKEQNQIVKHIEHESNKINKAISLLEKEIELVTEYRTRIISDVVTGKVDVRNIEVCERLPDQFEEAFDEVIENEDDNEEGEVGAD